MPTERFNQLSKAKKQRILKAAEAEFQASCAEKFSMTRIAKNASVSRASLYTYFVDREDIYFYSLAQAGKICRRILCGIWTRMEEMSGRCLRGVWKTSLHSVGKVFCTARGISQASGGRPLRQTGAVFSGKDRGNMKNGFMKIVRIRN